VVQCNICFFHHFTENRPTLLALSVPVLWKTKILTTFDPFWSFRLVLSHGSVLLINLGSRVPSACYSISSVSIVSYDIRVV